jgi:hypothetical protein
MLRPRRRLLCSAPRRGVSIGSVEGMGAGNSVVTSQMRQPPPVFMTIAMALIQCVMRTINGWIFLGRERS